MSDDAVRDFLAAELAVLTEEIAAPVEPFGFGSDLSCVTDLDSNLSEVAGDSPLGMAQAAIRRLITDRGSLIDDPDYGFGLISLLNRPLTAAELRSMPARMSLELEKDDRVAESSVEIAFAGTTLRVKILLEHVDPAVADIDFTFAVTDGAAALEALAA